MVFSSGSPFLRITNASLITMAPKRRRKDKNRPKVEKSRFEAPRNPKFGHISKTSVFPVNIIMDDPHFFDPRGLHAKSQADPTAGIGEKYFFSQAGIPVILSLTAKVKGAVRGPYPVP